MTYTEKLERIVQLAGELVALQQQILTEVSSDEVYERHTVLANIADDAQDKLDELEDE